jgi:hypothetical protein
MITERNVTNMLIVKNVNTTISAGTNVSAELAGMNTGESIITTPGGVVVDSASLPTEFKIGTKLSTGKIQWSDIIKLSSIKSIYADSYSLATLQTDYVGYNGTSGSIDAINSNIYTLRLYRLPLDMAGFAQQRVNRGVYKSDTTASQQEIAKGVCENLISNMSKDPEKTKFGTDIIKVERINSGALLNAMAAGGAATATVVKGSKYVTLSTDQSTTCPAGSIIRLGGTGAGTTPCYGVVAISASGLIVTLDQAYQGASAVIAEGSVETVTEGNWGIKLTGVKFSFDAPKFGYLLPRWKTTLQDFGTTTVTESVISAEGTGMYEWVAQVEQQLQGSEGNFYRAQVPYPTFRAEAVVGGEYAIINIAFEDNMGTTLGGVANSYKQLIIACVKGAGTTYSAANVGLGTTLNAVLTAYPAIQNSGVTISTEIAA